MSSTLTTSAAPSQWYAFIFRSVFTYCKLVEQAVVYSTLPQEYSTLTFRGEVVAGGGGVEEERSDVLHRGTYIYILQSA